MDLFRYILDNDNRCVAIVLKSDFLLDAIKYEKLDLVKYFINRYNNRYIILKAAIYSNYNILNYILENIKFTQKELDNCDYDEHKDTYHYLDNYAWKLLYYYGKNGDYNYFKNYYYDDKIIVFLLDYEYQNNLYSSYFDINLIFLIFSYIM